MNELVERTPLPHEPMNNYTKVSNSLLDLYMARLPDFKTDHVLLYITLYRYYNEKYGYAFPDTYELALKLNCWDRKVIELKKTLIKYELIEKDRHPDFGNDVYFIKEPISDEAEFYTKWPEAKEHYEKRIEQFKKRKEEIKSERRKAFEERLKRTGTLN